MDEQKIKFLMISPKNRWQDLEAWGKPKNHYANIRRGVLLLVPLENIDSPENASLPCYSPVDHKKGIITPQ